MPFSDQVANGLYLVIPALRSPNYVAGTSGWTVNRDGTAEFANGTFRGSIDVTDPDGSRVHIFDENPGDGAIIDMYPATPATHTITTPVELRTDLVSDRPSFQIEGATIDGATPGPVVAMNSDELGNQFIGLYAPNIDLVGVLFNQSTSLFGGGLVTIANADVNIVDSRAGFTSTLEIDGGIRAGQRIYVGSIVNNTTICVEDSTSYDQGPAVADTRNAAGFVSMKNGAGGTFQHSYVKQYDAAESDLQVTLNMSLFITVAASGFAIQAKDNGTASVQSMVAMLNNVLADHKAFSVTRRFTGLPATAAGTLEFQWSRVSGGTLNRNADDYINVEVREVGIKS